MARSSSVYRRRDGGSPLLASHRRRRGPLTCASTPVRAAIPQMNATQCVRTRSSWTCSSLSGRYISPVPTFCGCTMPLISRGRFRCFIAPPISASSRSCRSSRMPRSTSTMSANSARRSGRPRANSSRTPPGGASALAAQYAAFPAATSR